MTTRFCDDNDDGKRATEKDRLWEKIGKRAYDSHLTWSAGEFGRKCSVVRWVFCEVLCCSLRWKFLQKLEIKNFSQRIWMLNVEL